METKKDIYKNINDLKKKEKEIITQFQEKCSWCGVTEYEGTHIGNIENITILAGILIEQYYTKNANLDIQTILYEMLEYQATRQTRNCVQNITDILSGNLKNLL